MRPTSADALDGAERLLRDLVAEGSLAPGDADPVLALLRQARVGRTARLPFLDEDNRAQLALLQDLAPALSPALAGSIAELAAAAPPAPLLDLDEADRHNAALRELLARAVRELPAGPGRERVRVYLLERVEREPA